MNHKFILQFYIRGNVRKPSAKNIGRFKASCFNYPNIEVLFTTEAESHEKLYDIIHEMNGFTQTKIYRLPEQKENIKYLYLDGIFDENKEITIGEMYKKGKLHFFHTHMFQISFDGMGARLKINLELPNLE